MEDLKTVAAKLIADVYAKHGRCTLECDCGREMNSHVDADAVGNAASISAVASLIEHAKFDHIAPRTILAVVVHAELETRGL